MLRSNVFAIALLAAVSLPAGFGFARSSQQPSDSRSSILQAKSETVRVRLLDAFSGKIISNSDVGLSSENTIDCRHAPCPSNANQSRLRSDANGYVLIPANILNVSTHISAPGYQRETDLIGGAEENIHGVWVVELIPNHTSDRSGPHLDSLKLIDAQSNKPLINRSVHFSFANGEGFKGKTNSLGYIFFPIDKTKIEGSVAVSGYRRKEFDRSAVMVNYYHWKTDNYRLKLERL